jgi:hypothetical protein
MATPTPSVPPFRIAAGPLAFHSSHVPATGKVTVWNTGTKPLDVTTSTLHLGGNCGNLRINPSHFALAPGTHTVLTVTDTIPNADLAAKYTAVLPGQHGIGTAGAMTSRFTTGHPVGTAACAVSKAVPVHVASHGGGFPWLLLIVILALAGVLAALISTRIRKNRKAV